MKITYIANDGQHFNSEEECRKYEEEYCPSIVHSRFWYYDSRPIEASEKFYEEWFFIYVATEQEEKIIKKILDDNGIGSTGIDGPGLYYYAAVGSWFNIAPIIEEGAKLLNHLDK